MLPLKFKNQFFRLFCRPESLYSVATFYGARNGWIVRTVRTKKDAEKFLTYLRRIEDGRIHKMAFNSFS